MRPGKVDRRTTTLTIHLPVYVVGEVLELLREHFRDEDDDDIFDTVEVNLSDYRRGQPGE